MVLNDSLFAQIKWFRPPGKIYGELWATSFIYTGVSILLMLFLFCPIWILSPPVQIRLCLCTRQILDAHSENRKNIFLNVCRDGVEISHKTPETQFSINDSHIR